MHVNIMNIYAEQYEFNEVRFDSKG